MNLEFVRNFPLFCIILTLFSGPLSMISGGRRARYLNRGVITAVGVMSFLVLLEVSASGSSYVYRMGLISRQYSFSTAVGLLRSVVGLILMVMANELSKRFTERKIF